MKTAIEQFIEDAIKGGYQPVGITEVDRVGIGNEVFYFNLNSRIQSFQAEVWLLDPKAWEAVGKVRGWAKQKHSVVSGVAHTDKAQYIKEMHRFIDHIIAGDTIEQALTKITT